jgi:hypothetical protein
MYSSMKMHAVDIMNLTYLAKDISRLALLNQAVPVSSRRV